MSITNCIYVAFLCFVIGAALHELDYQLPAAVFGLAGVLWLIAGVTAL